MVLTMRRAVAIIAAIIALALLSLLPMSTPSTSFSFVNGTTQEREDGGYGNIDDELRGLQRQSRRRWRPTATVANRRTITRRQRFLLKPFDTLQECRDDCRASFPGLSRGVCTKLCRTRFDGGRAGGEGSGSADQDQVDGTNNDSDDNADQQPTSTPPPVTAFPTTTTPDDSLPATPAPVMTTLSPTIAPTVTPAVVEEMAKLTALKGSKTEDIFGYSVALHDNVAVVGAIRADPTNQKQDAGMVYIYEDYGGTWVEVADFEGASSGVNFGMSVAVWGTTVVAGSPYDGGGGSAVVIERQGTAGSFSWTQAKDFLRPGNDATSTGDEFGYSVAINDADTVVVGAPGQSSGQGAAYVFVRADVTSSGGAVESSSSWTEVAKLVAADGATGDAFGRSIAIRGTTLVVGAPNTEYDGNPAGAVYVFEGQGNSWVEVAKLVPIDVSSRKSFGETVAVSGNVIAVGVRLDDDNGYRSGAAYVFERRSGKAATGGRWTESAKITATDGRQGEDFGAGVSLYGASSLDVSSNNSSRGEGFVLLAIGAPADEIASGSVYLYEKKTIDRNDEGNETSSWFETAKFAPKDARMGDKFGFCVAVSDGRVVASAPFDDDDDEDNSRNSDSGSAYLFTIVGCC